MTDYDHRHFAFVRQSGLPRGAVAAPVDSRLRRAVRAVVDALFWLYRGGKW
jgi:hypothetical protein